MTVPATEEDLTPDALLRVALEAAQLAADVHRRHAGTIPRAAWSEKGTSDFVSHVDLEAESCIVDHISAHFPAHRIMAEETAAETQSAEWLWIIDPLDGTTNYLHGYPVYAVSIAVRRRDRLLAGVVLDSARGDIFTATAGGGAFRNDTPLRVSGVTTLRDALIGTGFPFKALDLLPTYTAQFEQVLRSSSGIRRAGAAALDLCHLAAGWFDGFWELALAPWDVAAGTLIVREAGGVVTRVDGSADVAGHGPVLAGNTHIHAALLELIGAVDSEGQE